MEQQTHDPHTDRALDGATPASGPGSGALPERVDWNAATPDAVLVEGMRADDERAYTEFVRRWQPLLSDAARRQGVATDIRDDLVADVLIDATTAFGCGRPAPRAMAAYLVAALRNRARNASRDTARREARERESTGGDLDPSGDLASSRRSPFPAPDAAFEPGTGEVTNPVLATLAAQLQRDLTRDDRLLLVWAGHRVPHREIAAWLVLGRAAVAKRLERLRVRLRQVAVAYVAQADPATRAELLRFFARAEVALEDPDPPDDDATDAPAHAGPSLQPPPARARADAYPRPESAVSHRDREV